MTALPEDWREQVVALLAGPQVDDASARAWFAQDPRRTPERQLGIYRDQIHLRLTRVLRGAVAGLAAFEPRAFDALAGDYLRAFPARSWTLHRLADDLPAWLAANPTGDAARDAARRDLVALDLAVGRARRAADGPPLGALDASTPLRLAPSARVLWLDRPWHAWRRAALAEAPPYQGLAATEPGERPVAPPPPAPTTVVVYRRAGEVRDQELRPVEAALLAAFEGGATLADAVAAVAATDPDPAGLVSHVGPWFRRFAERGWLVDGRA